MQVDAIYKISQDQFKSLNYGRIKYTIVFDSVYIIRVLVGNKWHTQKGLLNIILWREYLRGMGMVKGIDKEWWALRNC